MVPIDADRCIDSHESPGRGRMPEAGLPLADAGARCKARGAALCAGDEWERACRGPDGASWPFGTAFRRGPCNLHGGEPAITGSFPECRSAVGAYDMSGNVAEWVADGKVKGGSTEDGSDGRCSREARRPGGGAQGFADVGFRCCADARR
jgi:formylglycine-generating enzyme required for sulfatase activity